MNLNPSVIKAQAQLKGALADGDLHTLARVQQRLIDLLITATIDDDDATIREIRTMTTGARNEMVWRFKTRVDEGADALAWMFEAGSRVASAAARARPLRTKVREADMGVRDRILRALSRSNRPLTNTELAARCGTTRETVSRILSALHAEGLVDSRKAGVRRINSLTTKGRAAVTSPNVHFEVNEKNPVETTKISAEVWLSEEPKLRVTEPEETFIRLPTAQPSKQDRSKIINSSADRVSLFSRRA